MKKYVILLLFFWVTHSVFAQLDSSLSGSGVVYPPFSFTAWDGFSLGEEADQVLVQTDGKILLRGYFVTNASDQATRRTVLLRYNVDGTLDTGFGNEGKVVAPYISGTFYNYSKAMLDVNGKIVLFQQTFGGNVVILRINDDGSVDNTFGSGGILNVGFGLAPNMPTIDMEITSSGKINLLNRLAIY